MASPARVLLLTLLIALATAGCRDRERGSAPPPAGSDPSAVITVDGCGRQRAAGSTVEKIRSGVMERSYRLHVPAGYDPARRTPVVLNFHGFGSNAREQEAYSRITRQAEAGGFIAVTPDGTGNPRRWYIYGAGEPGYVDDFGFVRDLLDHLGAELCVDPDRVYAMGISNGGGMSSLLACELDGRLAAIAPVAGSPFSDARCRGKKSVAVIAFHGTDDALVPFEGGAGGRLGLSLRSVRQNMEDWAAHNGCASALASERVAADVVRESYRGCREGADVVLYVVEGGGHTWPGAAGSRLGRTTGSIDATALIWQFFAAHPR